MKILDAIKKLNAAKKEDGELLLSEPIDMKALKGAKEQELAEAYMNAIEGISVEDEDKVPDELADVYNELADAEKERKADVVPEKPGKASATKVAKKKPAAKVSEKKSVEKKEKVSSPYGVAMDLMCANPDMPLKDLRNKLQKKGFDTDKSKSAINTAYSTVRKVSTQLLKNGWKK